MRDHIHKNMLIAAKKSEKRPITKINTKMRRLARHDGHVKVLQMRGRFGNNRGAEKMSLTKSEICATLHEAMAKSIVPVWKPESSQGVYAPSFRSALFLCPDDANRRVACGGFLPASYLVNWSSNRMLPAFFRLEARKSGLTKNPTQGGTL